MDDPTEAIAFSDLTIEDTKIFHDLAGKGVVFTEGVMMVLPSGREIEGSKLTKMLRQFEAF